MIVRHRSDPKQTEANSQQQDRRKPCAERLLDVEVENRKGAAFPADASPVHEELRRDVSG